MNLETNLIFLVIFGLISFITDKKWGFNPNKIYSDLGSMLFAFTFVIIILPVLFNPNAAFTTIEKMVWVFKNAFPGMVVGEIAGVFVSRITYIGYGGI